MSRKAHTALVELGQLCHSPLVAADMAEFGALLLCLAAQLLSEGRRGSAVFLPPSAVPHFAAPVRGVGGAELSQSEQTRLEGVLKAGWWLEFVIQHCFGREASLPLLLLEQCSAALSCTHSQPK